MLILYLACNIVAIAMQAENPLMYFALMLHLIDMFVLSPSLGNVTRAVSSRSQTLLQTAGLAFIMVSFPRIHTVTYTYTHRHTATTSLAVSP